MPKGFKKAYNNSVTKDKEENGKGKIARKHLCHRICTDSLQPEEGKAAYDCELLYPSTILNDLTTLKYYKTHPYEKLLLILCSYLFKFPFSFLLYL